MTEVRPGAAPSLGATWDGEGTNFAIFSEHGTQVELCLFNHPGDANESQRIDLTEQTHYVWQAYLPNVRPGQAYGFRVHGPYAPAQGHCFNPTKLLLDPYAKAISGTMRWSDAFLGYPLRTADPARGLVPDSRDSAGDMPKSLVVDPAFAWDDDRPPMTPWNRTIIYEAHVKGMTVQHPEVPEKLRGTYLGLATDPVIDHLANLGITAIELLPIHHLAAERRLAEQGLTNYWGYNSIGYFAPDARYATSGLGQQVTEFKAMVKRFHEAGIEVLLDVVYNHTGEGGHVGSTLCFRGLDNAVYYRMDSEFPRRYVDFTGCGNTLDFRNSATVQLVLDSLRYWVAEMHVDGFRFDIAPVLGRDEQGFDPTAEFFVQLQRDPILSRVKLIAEPWDLGPDGYQLGRFPVDWSEWNGKYRDTVRRFWRGDPGQVGDLAFRLSGSSDLYESGGRAPRASVNFVTCHDGFTLQDLVSYEAKHNLSNGEENRDGTNHNLSRNWGIEGPTEVPRTVHMRERMRRNFLATLAFSQGVPMLSHGDELGRTQSGNNNAYCHDSPLTWIDWRLTPSQRELLRFTRSVFAIRTANPLLRRRTFFQHRGPGDECRDLTWLRPDGKEMTAEDWTHPKNHALAMLMQGNSEEVEYGEPATGDALLLLLNGAARSQEFVIPTLENRGSWTEIVNTTHPGPPISRQGQITVGPRSLMLLRHS